MITNLECLKDCFPNKKGQNSNSCLGSLLDDVIINGVCPTITADYEYQDIYFVNYDYCSFSEGYISSGTCSELTENLLLEDACRNQVFEQQSFIQNTLLQLIFNSCKDSVVIEYIEFDISLFGFRRNDINLGLRLVKNLLENFATIF